MTFVEWLRKAVDDKCNGNVTLFQKRLSVSGQSLNKYLSGKIVPQRCVIEEMILVYDLKITQDVFNDYRKRVLTSGNGYKLGSITLCWECQNSVPDSCGRGCSWSRKFKPVEGWEAIRTQQKGYETDGISYYVLSCPEFVPDNPHDVITSQFTEVDDYGSRFTETAEYLMQKYKKIEEIAKVQDHVKKRDHEYKVKNSAVTNAKQREKYRIMKIENPELYEAIKRKNRERYKKRKEVMDG